VKRRKRPAHLGAISPKSPFSRLLQTAFFSPFPSFILPSSPSLSVKKADRYSNRDI